MIKLQWSQAKSGYRILACYSYEIIKTLRFLVTDSVFLVIAAWKIGNYEQLFIIVLPWTTFPTVALSSVQFSSVAQSCANSLQPHESQHARPPCPSPTPGVHSNSRPLSRWCHPAISSSLVPFSSCPQSLPPSGSFQMSQLFTSGGQSTGVSASTSVLPMNTQDWSPLGWTGWISLQSKGLSRVFANTTVQKINSSALSFLYSPTYMTIYMT